MPSAPAEPQPSSNTKSPIVKSPITSTPESQGTTNETKTAYPSILPISPRLDPIRESEQTTATSELSTPPLVKATSEPPAQKPIATELHEPESFSTITSSASTPSAEIPPSGEPNNNEKPVQLNKGRCFKCRVKIPLAKQTVNKCRCNYTFCDSHRYPDRHDCDFDYAKLGRDLLAKNNPKLNQRPKGGRTFQRIDSL